MDRITKSSKNDFQWEKSHLYTPTKKKKNGIFCVFMKNIKFQFHVFGQPQNKALH